MKRRGRIAAALFSALSAAGVLTLFSQADLATRTRPGGAGSASTSLDPGSQPSRDFGDLMPAALRNGAVIQAGLEDNGKRPAPTRLRLR
jgi:hypothetical protein